MVVFDTSILLLLIHPGAKPPLDPETGQPVERAAERVAHLAKTLSDAREKVVVPTPVLSELLVHAGEATGKYLDILNDQAAFRIAPFDQKAALEAAIAMKDALSGCGHEG